MQTHHKSGGANARQEQMGDNKGITHIKQYRQSYVGLEYRLAWRVWSSFFLSESLVTPEIRYQVRLMILFCTVVWRVVVSTLVRERFCFLFWSCKGCEFEPWYKDVGRHSILPTGSRLFVDSAPKPDVGTPGCLLGSSQRQARMV